MLKRKLRHPGILLAEHTISLYITALLLVTAAGLFSFCQWQLHRERELLHYYMSAEQLTFHVPKQQVVLPPIKVQQTSGAIKVEWKNGIQIDCHILP